MVSGRLISNIDENRREHHVAHAIQQGSGAGGEPIVSSRSRGGTEPGGDDDDNDNDNDNASAPGSRGQPTEARMTRIARRAHEIYEARGGEHGKAMEDWLQAEREVDAEMDAARNIPE